MKSSKSSQPFTCLFEANLSWAKVLSRTVFVAALALVLSNTARAQTQLLLNPDWTNGVTDWTLVNNAIGNCTTGNSTQTYYNSASGECPQDPTAQAVNVLVGAECAKIYGAFNASPNISEFTQTFAAAPGATWSAGGYGYSSHEDLMGGNQFWYEVDFYNTGGTLLAAYESLVVENLTCSNTAPFAVDTWVGLPVTNVMQVTTGTNTGTVTGNTGSTGVFTSPAGTATVTFRAVYDNINYAGGSIYLDEASLTQISGPVAPTVSTVTPNEIIFCTNAFLTCTASSTTGTITNVALTITTTALGGSGSNTLTTNLVAPAVTGLGTATASVNYPLTTNLIYNVTVVATTDDNLSGVKTASFDTLTPTLVIEAEDFNFSSGGYMNTPADGGLALFANAPLGVSEIDYQKNPANGTQAANGSYYRNTDVIINGYAAPVNGTEQKYITAASTNDTTDVPVEVGYNGVGDWLDYTRTFGSDATNSAASGTYAVWARLATVGSGTALNFYQITAGQDTTNQTLSQLGSFSFTDNNWNGFDYAPLLDQFGNLVAVTLSGQETFRGTVVGNPNIDFYMLVPAVPILTPSLRFAYPDGLHPFEATNSLTFTIGPANGTNIAASGIHLVLNGVDVTSSPKFTLTQSGSSWTASYSIQSNAIYNAVINATNTAGLSSTFNVSFDTFDVNNYQLEFADYDFSTNNGSVWISGLYIENPVPTCDINASQQGELATNSYFAYPTGFTPALDPNGLGAIAQQNIDVSWVDGQPAANDYYRNDGVGTEPTGDYLRPQFIAAQKKFNDPNIGPFQIGYFNQFNWLNYTRKYPTNNYYVWGRLAGGAGAFGGTLLSMVTNGWGTANQSSNVLGTFSDPLAAGWEAYHWVPLLDSSSNMAVVSLGGKATLTLTSGNNLNAAFMMLVPAAPQFQVTPSVVSGQLNLSFFAESGHTYNVVYKSSLSAATWTTVGSPIAGNGAVTNVIAATTLTGPQGYYTLTIQ